MNVTLIDATNHQTPQTRQSMDVLDMDRETLQDLLLTALNKVRKNELKKLADKYKLYLSDANTVDIAKLNMATVSQLKRDFRNLPDEQLHKLLIELYGSSKITSTNPNKCSICLRLMGRQMNDTGCSSGKHWAHWTCLAKTGKEQCPMCREPIEIKGQSDALAFQKVMDEFSAKLAGVRLI